jgi:hypothetical protein
MTLTLGNDLTGSVAREVSEASRKSSGLGESLTTGNNKFVEVVDGFLGSSLRDNEIVLGTIAKNTAYSINMLTITDEYLKTISAALQEGLKTIGSAGPLSADKLAVLQKNLNDKRSQADLMIKTADFDGKALLSGGARSTDVQVGLSITDKLTLKVTDIGTGKLFRSSVTTALNDNIVATGAGASTYYANATELATDVSNNGNLVHLGLTNNANGAGSGAAMTNAEFEVVLNAVIGNNASVASFLNTAAPTALAFLRTVGGANTRTFSDANGGDVNAVMADANSRAEILAILQDGAATNISVAGNEANRVLAQDVFTNALNSIRAEQASVSNQKQNVVEAADALRATTNVTQKAADSYLKTDYVMTAQQYSETIRTMVASITALQAANKIPEAAQRLIDALAR